MGSGGGFGVVLYCSPHDLAAGAISTGPVCFAATIPADRVLCTALYYARLALRVTYDGLRRGIFCRVAHFTRRNAPSAALLHGDHSLPAHSGLCSWPSTCKHLPRAVACGLHYACTSFRMFLCLLCGRRRCLLLRRGGMEHAVFRHARVVGGSLPQQTRLCSICFSCWPRVRAGCTETAYAAVCGRVVLFHLPAFSRIHICAGACWRQHWRRLPPRCGRSRDHSAVDQRARGGATFSSCGRCSSYLRWLLYSCLPADHQP
jgi:hypothetical protein